MKYLIFVFMLIIPFTVDAYTPSETATQVITSLQTEPDHWFHDQYRLYYFRDRTVKAKTPKSSWEQVADCTIWIANGDFGIEIQSPKRVKFHIKTREKIWKIYQDWTGQHFTNNVFSHLEEGVKFNKPIEQIIKLPQKKKQLLTNVGNDKPILVEKAPDSTWKLIALMEATILLAIICGLGIFYNSKRRRHSSAR